MSIYVRIFSFFFVERLELIHDIIRKNPAVRFNDVMRISKLKNGTLTHYISKLENMEKNMRESPLTPQMDASSNLPKTKIKFSNDMHEFGNVEVN